MKLVIEGSKEELAAFGQTMGIPLEKISCIDSDEILSDEELAFYRRFYASLKPEYPELVQQLETTNNRREAKALCQELEERNLDRVASLWRKQQNLLDSLS